MNYRYEWANGNIEAGTLLDAIDQLRAELAASKFCANVADDLRAELGALKADHLASHAFDEGKERALADQFIKAQQSRLAKGGHAPLTGIEESAMRGAWLACAKSRAKAAGCL